MIMQKAKWLLLVAASVSALVSLATSSNWATEALGNVDVTVTGQSNHSYERAKEDGLRKAVEQGAGKEVFSDTKITDFALMHDTVISRAAGYVKGYDVLERKHAKGVYSVKIRATVAVGKIKDDWGAIQILLERTGFHLLIVVEEKVVHYITDDPLPETGNVAEYKLNDLFDQKDFYIVDNEVLNDIGGRDAFLAMVENEPDKASSFAHQHGANYIVHARAIARAREGGPYGIRGWAVDASLPVKIVATDSAKRIASKMVSEKDFRQDPTTAARIAFESATKEVFPELLYEILHEWSSELDRGKTVHAWFTRISTDLLNQIVDKLRATPKIKSARIRDHNRQLTHISVMTRLESRELGSIIEKVSGKKVQNTKISPYRIDFQMRHRSKPSDHEGDEEAFPVQSGQEAGEAPITPSPPTEDDPVGETWPVDADASDPSQPGAIPETAREFEGAVPLPENASGTETGPLPQDETCGVIAAIPSWVLPATVGAVAVILAFLAGMFLARRKGTYRSST